MSDNDRFIGQLEDYLDDFDGETPLPMHLRDAIRTALPGTGQERSGRVPRRVLTMFASTPVRGGLLAAGLVIAVGLGAMAVNRPPSGVGGLPSASAASSATPTPSLAASPSADVGGAMPISQASPAPCYEGGEATCIAAGTYALDPTTIPGRITVTVPEGWFPFEPGAGATALLVDSGPDAAGGSGWGPMISAIQDVRLDPCAVDGAVFDRADIDTPSKVAAAIAKWPDFNVTDPVAITFAGAPGVQVDVSGPEDRNACLAQTWTWSTTQGTWIDGYPMVGGGPTREPATFRILDVGGELLIIRTPASIGPSPFEAEQGVASDPERHAADLVEMNAILDSIRFGGADTP